MESSFMSEITQIRFCGFGGQGIVLMSVILADAAVRDGLWVAGANSYGAQARGSACQAETVLAREPVDFPHVLEADVLVAMSQKAYERFLPNLKPEGLAVYDEPQVSTFEHVSQPHVPIPATRKAVEELGNKQVANVVMLAACASLTNVVSKKALKEAVKENVPSRFTKLNLKALETGYALGEASAKT
jgi:2-oxoglutarate ferredoxin oxidoreductase subunit gamma